MILPGPFPQPTLLSALDAAATAAFGWSGAVAAARRGEGLLALAGWSAAVGLSGGAARDLALSTPVYWVSAPAMVAVALAAAGAAEAGRSLPLQERLCAPARALGAALFSVAGAAKAEACGAGPLSAAAVGVLAAAVGLLLQARAGFEPGRDRGGGLDFAAAALGSGLFVVMRLIGGALLLSLAAAGAASFLLASGSTARRSRRSRSIVP